MATHNNPGISTPLEITGEKEWKAAIDEAVRSVRMKGLEVKETSARYAENSDSIQANRDRAAQLQKQVDANNRLIEMYTQRLQQNAESGRENSKESQRYEEQLIKVRTAMASMNSELEKAQEASSAYTRSMTKVISVLDKGIGASVKEAASNFKQKLPLAVQAGVAASEKALKGLGTAAQAAGKAIKASISAAGAAMAAVGTAAVGLGASINALVTDTEEYRTTMSKLEQNSKDAGVSFDTVKDKMMSVASVTGDTDAAVEALSNLLASDLKGQGLTDAVDALTGAVIKFPDTLKIEGLADGLQETIATGQAAGSFAELLERMGMDTEKFNEQLAACGSESERQRVALKALADTGLSDVADAYRETNAASLEAKEATLRMNDSIASLASTLEPTVATMKSSFADVVTSMVGMVTGAEGAEQDFENAIDTLIGNVTNLLDTWLPKLLETGTQILQKLIEGILKALPKITEELPKLINSLLDFFTENLPAIIDAGVEILIGLCDGIIQSIPKLVEKLPDIISAIVNGLIALVPKLLDVGAALIKGLWEGIKNSIGIIRDGIANLGNSIVGWFKGVLGIHSPSTVMRDQIGRMMGLGVADGIIMEKDAVQNALDSIIPNGRTIRYNIAGAATAARSAMSARPVTSTGTTYGYNADLSDACLDRLSDKLVTSLVRAGFGDVRATLNGRELMRVMRRGAEVGFA